VSAQHLTFQPLNQHRRKRLFGAATSIGVFISNHDAPKSSIASIFWRYRRSHSAKVTLSPIPDAWRSSWWAQPPRDSRQPDWAARFAKNQLSPRRH